MEKKPSLLQFTMTYGAILGIVSIIFSVILYITGYMPYNFKRMGVTLLINLVILIVFMVMGTRTYRDKILNGTISYGRTLLIAMLIVAFSTIIGSIYTFVFNLFIDPEYVNKVFEATKSSLYDSLSNMGLPEAQIEQSIDRIENTHA